MIHNMNMEINAKLLKGHEKATKNALDGLIKMLNDFDDMKTKKAIDNHMLMINGYAQALVNIGIIDEEEVNSSIGIAVCLIAASRSMQLEKEE